jgi:NTP pyrophosphatase (non-canonical NTP hydrolase)
MSDRIREHARANHALHGVSHQPAADAFLYLLTEVAELGQALRDLRLDDCAETRAQVNAEVADCVIVLDHILEMTTGRLLDGAVTEKVLADRVQLAALGGAR